MTTRLVFGAAWLCGAAVALLQQTACLDMCRRPFDRIPSGTFGMQQTFLDEHGLAAMDVAIDPAVVRITVESVEGGQAIAWFERTD